MITRLYNGRVGRYYPETAFYEAGTGVRAVVAVPFGVYDFADEAAVPSDGDWTDPEGAYRPEPAEAEPAGPTLMEERQAWQEALAADAAAAREPEPAEPEAAAPRGRAVRSAQAGAPDPASTVPAAAGQEG